MGVDPRPPNSSGPVGSGVTGVVVEGSLPSGVVSSASFEIRVVFRGWADVGQDAVEPCPQFVAKGFFVFGVAKIHESPTLFALAALPHFGRSPAVTDGRQVYLRRVLACFFAAASSTRSSRCL